MYQAARWNEDPAYFSPTATINGNLLFINDFVLVRLKLKGRHMRIIGKIEKFFKKVR